MSSLGNTIINGILNVNGTTQSNSLIIKNINDNSTLNTNNNTIQTLNSNNLGSDLYINPNGGKVHIGPVITIDGDVLSGITIRGNAENVSGVVQIEHGGTGATTADKAISNLGIKASVTEINYLSGVTSNIQTQFTDKLSTTGTAANSTKWNGVSLNKTTESNTTSTVYVPMLTGSSDTEATLQVVTSDSTKDTIVKRDSSGQIKASYFVGNATSASKIQTGRKITLSGCLAGAGTFDGSQDITITTASNGIDYMGFKTTINLSDAKYDVNTWYPVVGTKMPFTGMHKLKCYTYLDGGKPSWATHDSGFTCDMEIYATPVGYGTTDGYSYCTLWHYKFCSVNPLGYVQLGTVSAPVVYMRGGGKYYLWTDYNCTWTVKTDTYSVNTDSVKPETSNPGVKLTNKAVIQADLEGIAAVSRYSRVTDTSTAGSWYYSLFMEGLNSGTNYLNRGNAANTYYLQIGTTTQYGRSLLRLGNEIKEGVQGNVQGELRLFTKGAGHITISGTKTDSNFAITLPAASGTVALTSHTHSVATTSDNGFMSSSDKTKLNGLHYVRSGTTVPVDTLGENGDIYVLTES